MPEFSEKYELVIRGVLQKYELVIRASCRFSNLNEAQTIHDALFNAFNERWSIIVYATCLEESGYDNWFHYENKWWVYGTVTTNPEWKSTDEAIKTFLDDEFGWAMISDCSKVQSSAQKKINNNFLGSWRVHVVKFRPDSTRSWAIYGTNWAHSGYQFYIMRTS
jgi:hypothetical protein